MNSHDIMSALRRKPAAQAVGRQAPVAQETAVLLVTRPVLQAIAQPPQWVAVLRASQPLRALESQLEKPPLQTIEHAPPAQEGMPPVLEHTIPQPPQWLVAVCVLTQPAPEAEQSTVGARQVVVHDPPEQRVPAAQTVAQPPQLPLSVAVLTHLPLHDTWPVGQVHVPLTQSWPPEQERAQAPQLALSEARPVSQPLFAFMSQLPKPEVQVPSAQALDAQEAEALGNTQRLPQLPQCATAVRWSTSHPLPTLPSQLPKLALQVMDAQTPPEQLGVPLVALHTRPQVPQLDSSVLRFTSQPSGACALQSASGAGHIAPALHELIRQMGVRPTGGVQRVAHAPQWLVSERMSVSQPSMGFMLQSAKPALHEPIAQSPPAQTAAALAKRQRLPQVPQLAASLMRLTSQPLVVVRSQSPKPSWQAVCVQRLMLHAPKAFLKVISQSTPHPLQFRLLLVRSTQLLPQRVSPVGQRQAPLPHTWPSGQRRPHIPQLLMSAIRLVQPVPAQKLCPEMGQVHTPVRHASPGLHARAQVPQLV